MHIKRILSWGTLDPRNREIWQIVKVKKGLIKKVLLKEIAIEDKMYRE